MNLFEVDGSLSMSTYLNWNRKKSLLKDKRE